MNVEFVNPFIEATLYILDTTAGVKVRALPPYRKRDNVTAGDITGMMTMTGDVTGSIGVTFTEKSILGIVSTMFGEEMTELDDDIKDAVGEVANMISGHVATKMAELDRTCTIKLTGVETGRGHTVVHGGDNPVAAIPFSSNMGNFTIEVCIGED